MTPALRMREFIFAAVILAFIGTPALAEDPPKLPAGAKRLSGPQIVALYDGKTFQYRSWTFFGVVTGEVSYDFKTETNHGTYALGARKGTFEGHIRIEKDRFCYKTGRFRERCDTVYVVDGEDAVYEVKPSGIVGSVNRLVIPPA